MIHPADRIIIDPIKNKIKYFIISKLKLPKDTKAKTYRIEQK